MAFEISVAASSAISSGTSGAFANAAIVSGSIILAQYKTATGAASAATALLKSAAPGTGTVTLTSSVATPSYAIFVINTVA